MFIRKLWLFLIIDCKYDKCIEFKSCFLYKIFVNVDVQYVQYIYKDISIIVYDLKFNWHLLGNVEKAFEGILF